MLTEGKIKIQRNRHTKAVFVGSQLFIILLFPKNKINWGCDLTSNHPKITKSLIGNTDIENPPSCVLPHGMSEHALPEELIYYRLCNHETGEIEAETHPGYFVNS